MRIKFSIYIKPTNTFSYLNTESNHTSFIFRNIPKSLLIRVRRFYSDDVDYWYFASKLILQLMHRGYDFNKLMPLAFTISNIDRNSLLEYKTKTRTINKTENSMFFGTEFNGNFTELNNEISSSFQSIAAKSKFFQNYKLMLYKSMGLNINSIFVHNSNAIRSFYKNTKRCYNDNCKTCFFVNSNNYICLKHNFYVPIQSQATSNSKNIVYIIRCLLCNEFYIGQSQKLVKIRIKQHLQAILNFKPYIKYTNEVGYHFNLKGHKYIRDFQFYVFKCDIEDVKERLSVETDLIHLFKDFNPPIMNKKIPTRFGIKSLAFL